MRERGRGRDVVALGTVLTGMLLSGCPCALALNPALDVSQYAHRAWTVRDGFFKSAIKTITQTPDGYLWLGTEFGLLRFDGIRSVPWVPPGGERLPSNNIAKLLVTRDGRLWIGTFAGLVSWKDGRLTNYPELAGQVVVALLEDQQGTIWAGGTKNPSGTLCAIQNGKTQCSGEDGSFGLGVLSLYEHKGNLWAGTGAGLWRWKPDPPKLYPMPVPAPEISGLIEGDNGALWIAMRGGLRQLVDGRAEPRSLPVSGSFRPQKLLRDREGGLWIGTSGQGLLHVHRRKTDMFASADGLSSDLVAGQFEDREGNIWVATNEGLDRFREFAVPTISAKQGLSKTDVASVLAANDGSVWLGTSIGLNRWDDGRITVYRNRSDRSLTRSTQQRQVREINDNGLPDNATESLFQDERGRIWVSTIRGVAYFEDGRFIRASSVPSGVVHSMAEETAGNLWINDQHHGLLHLVGSNVVEQIPWEKLEPRNGAVPLVADRERGGLWLGFLQGGLAYFKDGQVRASYAAVDGLGEGQVNGLQLERDGTLWAATRGGLSRIKNGRVATLTSKNGLPCDAVHWVMEDDNHSFWLYLECGLAHIARSELGAWAADSNHPIKATVFDGSDGVRSQWSTSSYSPTVAKSADGKLWFVTRAGVSVIDPHQLAFNELPPPVHIERITADGRKSEPSSHLRLPALVRDVSIEYTALSFVAPEKVRFRYKLEGQDRDWTEVVNQRQVHYSNLRPRNYRFRVAASNNSGVWNEAGASLDFSVAAAYYQTTLFRLSCVAAFLALLAGLYQLRLRQVARRLNVRMEERVNERTRIARDLHDTLLQSFQGVLMKFSAVSYLIPERPDAQKTLQGVIEQARQALTEGRDAVQGLRSSTVVTNDLARAITTLGEELSADQASQNPPGFRVHVEGASRDLVPLVRDEVYRIAGEALRNAFRHAHAKRIEVEIRYDPRQLRMRVRDDGKGIDPKVLSEGGRSGHHGLPGMHERAKLVGGKLAVWSELDSGTEAELTIPAAVAYAKSPVAGT